MKHVDAVIKKGEIVEPEHILHDNGVREVDGRFYGRNKPQDRGDRERVVSNTVGESLTKQSEATINGYHVNDVASMVDRASRGIPVPGAAKAPRYLDITALPSMEQSLNNIASLHNDFSMLDPKVRQVFRNDPRVLVDFLSDPANMPDAVKLGLVDPKVLPLSAEPPQAAPVTPAA